MMKTANFTTAEDELKILCIVVSPLQQQVESMLHHRGYLGHGIDISLLLPSTVDRLGAFWR